MRGTANGLKMQNGGNGMKIKTIAYELNNEGMALFDDEVNRALANGWHLAKREILPGYNLGSAYYDPMTYAELILPDASAMPDPQTAARIIMDVCNDSASCGNCPLHDICDCDAPYKWTPPEDGGLSS